jgi:phosphatidylglycerophosphatase A
LKKNLLINAISSFLFTGYIPVAPGTWASLLAVLIWLIIPGNLLIIKILLIVCFFIIGIIVAGLSESYSGIIDPSYIVIDEVVGMWLALLFFPPGQTANRLLLIFLTFCIFRLFDITKLFPINKCEKLHGGFGIMLDDIVAGIFTAIIMNLIIWLL